MKTLLFTIVACGIVSITRAQTYTVDKNHTRVGFSATHFGISKVDGRFKDVSATMTSKKEDYTDAVIEMTTNVSTIDTDNDTRDKDLRSENWLDANKYPTINFKSTSFKKTGGNTYELTGNITIHGITKPITFQVVYNGKEINPATKKNTIGFTVTGKLNRQDFQVGTGPASAIVGDEIELRSSAGFIVD
ncbi:MAG: YceI family protein [Bacteroidetes bacterium]|jgi:polyisoprenoid-binding protein YceI|nr:YceI family protein [Bacteroidota bacterium]MDF2452939.1 YceI family protein [Bacteroidota bacterium]